MGSTEALSHVLVQFSQAFPNRASLPPLPSAHQHRFGKRFLSHLFSPFFFVFCPVSFFRQGYDAGETPPTSLRKPLRARVRTCGSVAWF